MPTDDTDDRTDTETDDYRQVYLGLEPDDESDGYHPTGSTATQIQLVELYEYDVAVQADGLSVSWDVIDDPRDPDEWCHAVLRDREKRVDAGRNLGTRPPVMVFTIDEAAGEIIRVEYYEGDDHLSLTYDLHADPDAEPFADPSLDTAGDAAAEP